MASNVIAHSIKWSSLSEIGVKLITPITTMILARLLTPEAFGILAVCSMIVFFADIIADAGFGKYIVQADFEKDKDLYNYASVAFWSHFIVALFIWIVVFIFGSKIAIFLGIEGHKDVIIVTCSQLLLLAIVSTQLSILRRKFLFKKAFIARIASALTSLCVTLPIAFITKSYWSLVIGHLSSHFVNAIILSVLSGWLPKFYYSFKILKEMFSFSIWSLCEGLAHWFIFWFDVFIVTQFYSTYLVGLYKNSTALMLSFIGMITASMSPVLLSILSRLKEDDSYYDIYMRITRLFMYVIIPICLAIFFCRDFVTLVLLGEKWMEAANIIGAWSLMLALSVFIYSFPAEIYKSRGVPKYLFFYQLSFILFLVPICYFSARIGFWTFVYVRCACILIQVILFFIFNRIFLGWHAKWIIVNLQKPILGSVIFACLGFATLTQCHEYWIKIPVCIIVLGIYAIVSYKIFGKDIIESRKILSSKTIR